MKKPKTEKQLAKVIDIEEARKRREEKEKEKIIKNLLEMAKQLNW